MTLIKLLNLILQPKSSSKCGYKLGSSPRPLWESGFSVGRKPARANNMEITTKIRKDLLLLECYARPNNPRQGVGVRGQNWQEKIITLLSSSKAEFLAEYTYF